MIRRYLNTVEESKMISGAGAMNPVCPREDGRLEWGNGVVSMLFDTAGDSPVRLCNVAGRGMGSIGGRVTDDGRTVLERDPRPIVEVRAVNTGSQDNRLTLIATVAGSVLRFVSAAASGAGGRVRRTISFGDRPIRFVCGTGAARARVRTDRRRTVRKPPRSPRRKPSAMPTPRLGW